MNINAQSLDYSAPLEDYAQWTIEQRLQWIERWAHIYLTSTTREERIAYYRAKAGENVTYYDRFGWPENF